MHFGDTRYQHFKDSTGLKLWSKLDHGDAARRRAYRARHRGILDGSGQPAYKSRENAAYYAYHFLW